MAAGKVATGDDCSSIYPKNQRYHDFQECLFSRNILQKTSGVKRKYSKHFKILYGKR